MYKSISAIQEYSSLLKKNIKKMRFLSIEIIYSPGQQAALHGLREVADEGLNSADRNAGEGGNRT